MKNITIMKKTAMQKTAIAKITAKITTTALLFFLLLFTLTTNLRAQESGQQARKQGWFVGVSPFSFIGAEIKTSRTTTTEVDVVAGAATFDYQATIVSHFVNDSRGLTNGVITDAEAKQSLIRGAIELCKRSNAADATTGRIVDTVPLDPNSAVNSDYPTIDTRDFYIGYVGGQYNEASVDVTTEICDLPDIPPTVPNPTPPEPSASESAISLQGALAIQFGYNLGKYRVSLTSFSNKGGANRLTNNVLLADWFLTPGVYAGLGITSAKLETEIGSASQTMKEKLTPTNQPCFLTCCPDSWALKIVVKVNNSKKNSKAVVVIFAVIFAMAVFCIAVFFIIVIFFIVFSMVGF